MSTTIRPEGSAPKGRKHIAARVATGYALFASLWIVASDELLLKIEPELGAFAAFGLLKAMLFVIVTATLLYALLRRYEPVKPLQIGTGAIDHPLRPPDPAVAIAAFIALTFAIAIIAYYAYAHQGRLILKAQSDALNSIANLKAHEIEHWLDDLRAQGRSIGESPYLAEKMSDWLHGGDGERQAIVSHLQSFRDNFGYRSVMLLDADGRLRLSLEESYDNELAPLLTPLVEAAVRARTVQFYNLQRVNSAEGSSVVMVMVAPVWEPGHASTLLGAAAVVTDAADYLFPLIQSWPVQSESAESVLVRRDAERIVFLNELRHRSGTALRLSVPAGGDSLIARLLAGTGQGVVSAADYRGVPVQGVARTIRGTNWYLIAKVDRAEAVEPLRRLAINVGAASGIAMAFAAALVALAWRHQRLYYAVGLARAQRHTATLIEHFQQANRHANDIIVLTDDSGEILNVNPRAEEAYGRPRERLLGTSALDLCSDVEGGAARDRHKQVLERGAFRFEASHRRGDGTVFPVEVSARTFSVAGKTYIQSVVRDITDRRRAEEEVVRLNRLYAVITRANEMIVRRPERAQLLAELCDIAVHKGGLKLAWVGAPGKDGGLAVTSHAGGPSAYLAGLEVSIDPSTPKGMGPAARAFREGRHTVCNDFLADETALPWHRHAAAAGFAAAACFPLRTGGNVAAVLVVYAAERNFFTPDITGLFDQLAEDVSFALDAAEAERARCLAEERIERQVAKLQKAMETTIEAVSLMGELRDPYTAGHERRVGDLAAAIGTELGLSEDRVRGLRMIGYVHDVGKVTLPAEILSKPGRLTDTEFKLVKLHPQQGYEILKSVECPWPLAETVLQHHERLDGSGYPRGLKAEEILLEARIIAVADVVEAMASHRPYRPGLGIDKALEEVIRGAGAQYDRAAVEACVRLFREKGYELSAGVA